MRKDKKRVLFTVALLLGSFIISPVTVGFAAENGELQENIISDSELEIDLESNWDPSKNTENDDTLPAETDESEKEPVSYKDTVLPVTKSNFVADTLNGVDAVYRPGKNDGSNATYSCSAFIKKYYKKVYNVSVYNLFAGSTPRTYDGLSFKSVKSPKVGDIVYANSHWAIVKKVDKANKQVVLIEQNWKYQLNGQTVCKINRTVSWNNVRFYRLNQ